MNTELKIEGMSCGHCVSAVKRALEAVAGVKQADVDLANGRATVQHEGAPIEALIQAVDEEGYSAQAA